MTSSPAQTDQHSAQKYSAGPAGVRPALRVHECFEILADRQPAAPAVISDQGVLSYAELDQKANGMAHALIAHGVMP